jgi:DNA polymerase III subunit delta
MPPSKRQSTCSAVIAIFGDEDLLVRESLGQIIHQTFPDGVPDLAISEFDPEKAELAEVLDELRTLPFLSEKRLVLIRNADSFISRHRETLENYVHSPSPTGILVLVARTFDARTRLHKAVQQCGQVIKCQAPFANKIPGWIAERASTRYQKTIAPDACGKLKDLVGNVLSLLDAELDKLSLYVGKRATITAADVEALVGNNRDEKVFGIIDAMASGDAAQAINLWNQVWATDRNAEYRSIGGLAFSVRRLLDAKQLADSGVSLEDLARKLWTDSATLAARFRRFSVTDLQDQLATLLEVDVASKTGWANVRNDIEKFIITQCSKVTRSPSRTVGVRSK